MNAKQRIEWHIRHAVEKYSAGQMTQDDVNEVIEDIIANGSLEIVMLQEQLKKCIDEEFDALHTVTGNQEIGVGDPERDKKNAFFAPGRYFTPDGDVVIEVNHQYHFAPVDTKNIFLQFGDILKIEARLSSSETIAIASIFGKHLYLDIDIISTNFTIVSLDMVSATDEGWIGLSPDVAIPKVNQPIMLRSIYGKSIMDGFFASIGAKSGVFCFRKKHESGYHRLNIHMNPMVFCWKPNE